MFKFLAVTSLLTAFALGGTLQKRMDKDYPLFPDHSGRIVGGVKTTINVVPWQVSISYAFKNATGSYRSGLCGGSIISPGWVITAAHCVFNSDKSENRANQVTAGTTDGRNGSKHDIDKKILHYLYEFVQDTNTSLYDMALIRVVQDFIIDSRRRPVPLYVRAQKTLDGFPAVVSGWGAIRVVGGMVFPKNLNAMIVRITEKSECDDYLARSYKRAIAPVGQICGYYKGDRASCNGDSGGPVTVHGVLIGIVSFGSKTCGGRGKPSVFTEVARFRYWISDHTGI